MPEHVSSSDIMYAIFGNAEPLHCVHQKDTGHSPQSQTAIDCLKLARPFPKVMIITIPML